ncbi:MAG: tyrosine-type recombinase/integrase [Candidatus Omnitrophica bacterium]|nr:tyrosine-type recombinase/integrase [Candidatus Omnitrophota bacterium]
MGRQRKSRPDLPRRVYTKGNTYYFVDKDNKWHRLGKEFTKAMQKYAELIGDRFCNNMGQVIDRYLREVAPTKSLRTYKNYLEISKPLRAAFGQISPDRITERTIYKYMDVRPRVAANREKSLLSVVFDYAIRWGVATRNPCRNVRGNPEPPRDREVSYDEYLAVRDLATPSVRCAMDIAISTGLRLGNIIGMQVKDIQKEGLLIELIKKRSGKKPKRLLFEWDDFLRQAVDNAMNLHKEYKGARMLKTNQSYLICARDGGKYSVGGFKSIWQRLQRKALETGVISERFTFHDLRSFAADRAEDPTSLLGHDSPDITNRVYRRKPRNVKPAKISDTPN